MKKTGKKKIQYGQVALHTFYILVSLTYIIPIIYMFSISFSGKEITKYKLIPDDFSLFAFEMALQKPETIIRAYGVTAFYSIAGVLLGLAVMAMAAYALSRKNFRLRGSINKLILISMLIGAGQIPKYILISNYLHLNETIWVYIIPWLVDPWCIVLLKTYFMNLPNELFEAARIDGASELRCCFQMAVPLSMPILVTQGYAKFLGGWNDWSTCSIYVRRNIDIWSLQYVLKRFLDGSGATGDLLKAAGVSYDTAQLVAMSETISFAVAIIGVGPAFIVFPLIQKYYEKGLVVGSVKG